MICKTGLKNMVRPMLIHLWSRAGVYGTMLDATKAFDRIDYCKLFREMIKRKTPHLWYQNKSRFLQTVLQYKSRDKYRDTSMHR